MMGLPSINDNRSLGAPYNNDSDMGTITPKRLRNDQSKKYQRRGNISISGNTMMIPQGHNSMILTTQEAVNLESELKLQMGDFIQAPMTSQKNLSHLMHRRSNMLEVRMQQSESKSSIEKSVLDDHKSQPMTSSHMILDRSGNFYTI